MKKYLFVIIITYIFPLACRANSSILEVKPINNITIVFKKNPLANSAQQNQFYSKNSVNYFGDNFIEIKQELKNKLKDDTIKITTKEEFYPITLFHNYIYFNYLFKNGDTVVFDFDKQDIPNVNILNRDANQWERNFPILFKKRFNKILKGSNMIGPTPKNLPSSEVRFNRMYSEFNSQNEFIDSLLKQNLIQFQFVEYYKNENKANLYQNIRFKDVSSSLYTKIPKDQIITFANSADLLKAPFFHYFMEWYYIPSDILGIEKINLTQSITLNYAMAYDKISNHFTDPVVREYLLFYCVKKIKEESTQANYNTYLTKFKTINKNKAYIDILNSDEINNNISMGNTTIAMADVSGKQMDFNGFIKAAKGKVVYVDLWASWCAPCRAAMPASKKLKAGYANKAVVFTYLSIDVKKPDWLKAAEEENIKTDKNSFLLLSPKTSTFTKKLKLSTIPRYLIYNKKGELVNANAPGPDSPKLKDLLDRYLTEK